MNTDKNTLEIVLTKEIGKLLKGIREKAHLTQEEIGVRLGFSGKSGRVYVSKLERGQIENPSLKLILNYLTICEKPWSVFFEKLAEIYFDKQHQKIMAQVPTTKYYKKIDRDVAKYTQGIKTKFSEKQNIKPLTQEQKEKMAVEFGKYRVVMEQIEREITLLLGDSNEPRLYNQFYKAFARECYRVINKFITKSRKEENLKKISVISLSAAIQDNLRPIVEKWGNRGLKRNILEQIIEIPFKYIQPI